MVTVELLLALVSLLDSLKSPTAADITRKRQTKTNPPPVGERQCRGNTVSDPKSIDVSKRVQEFSEWVAEGFWW